MKNIKNLLLTIIVVFFTFSGFAQSNKIDIQVEGGPSLISIDRVLIDDKPTLDGFTGGIYSTYNLNKRFSIKSGLSYERKGFLDKFNATMSNGQSFGIIKTLYSLDYLVVPILFRANFGNKIRYFINGGPYLAYLLKQQSNGNGLLPYAVSVSLTNKSFDFGASAGVGCSYPLNNLLSISVEARNSLALVSLVDGGNLKSNSTNFILGITYHLKDSK